MSGHKPKPPATAAPDPPDAVRSAVERLLSAAADPTALGQQLAELRAEGVPLEPVIDQLGQTRSEDAARVLATIADEGLDRDVRKAARRALHRLRGAGLRVPELPRAPAAPAVRPAGAPRLAEVWATNSDGTGTRLLWFVIERPLGGITLLGAAVNDVNGLTDFYVAETTRKRFAERLAEWLEEERASYVQLPPDYGRALLAEALTLNGESGTPIPDEWQFHKDLIGPLPPAPERALAYDDVSPVEIRLRPDYLEDAPRLFGEPEVEGWFADPAELREAAQELLRARATPLVLAGESREERERRIIDGAINAFFTPERRRGLRRRLEELAYVFLRTDRPTPARLALAVAQDLESDRPATLNPFARTLIERTLEVAILLEQGGPASEQAPSARRLLLG